MNIPSGNTAAVMARAESGSAIENDGNLLIVDDESTREERRLEAIKQIIWNKFIKRLKEQFPREMERAKGAEPSTFIPWNGTSLGKACDAQNANHG